MTDILQIRHPASATERDLVITDATIRAPELRQFVIDGEPLATYDPGFMNTESCRSSITYIDGDAGILEYRGYPIAELAEKSTFLEVAWLLLNGELPNPKQLADWESLITEHRMLPDKLKKPWLDTALHLALFVLSVAVILFAVRGFNVQPLVANSATAAGGAISTADAQEAASLYIPRLL